MAHGTQRYVLAVPPFTVMILKNLSSRVLSVYRWEQLGQTGASERLREKERSRSAGTKDITAGVHWNSMEVAQAAYLQDAVNSSESLCVCLRSESPQLWFTVVISGQRRDREEEF